MGSRKGRHLKPRQLYYIHVKFPFVINLNTVSVYNASSNCTTQTEKTVAKQLYTGYSTALDCIVLLCSAVPVCSDEQQHGDESYQVV